jgi:hypothetical protein
MHVWEELLSYLYCLYFHFVLDSQQIAPTSLEDRNDKRPRV